MKANRMQIRVNMIESHHLPHISTLYLQTYPNVDEHCNVYLHILKRKLFFKIAYIHFVWSLVVSCLMGTHTTFPHLYIIGEFISIRWLPFFGNLWL